MNFLDKWLVKRVKAGLENSKEEAQSYNETRSLKMGTMAIGSSMVERGRAEGEGRITFELSSAVGGKILNVRHYDERKDRHENQTYVIPNGEDIGERVAKIINLEMFKL